MFVDLRGRLCALGIKRALCLCAAKASGVFLLYSGKRFGMQQRAPGRFSLSDFTTVFRGGEKNRSVG